MQRPMTSRHLVLELSGQTLAVVNPGARVARVQKNELKLAAALLSLARPNLSAISTKITSPLFPVLPPSAAPYAHDVTTL